MKLLAETKQDYVTYLLTSISDSQELIYNWQALADKWPDYTEDFGDLIQTEKGLLARYQGELKCIT